jgi:PleD family two-component response regulator
MEQVLSANRLLKILVIDDDESVLSRTVDILRKNYPNAEFPTAVNAHNVLNQRLTIDDKRGICRFREEALCNVGKYATGVE